MATFDPNIALQVRPLQDPIDSYGKALTLKGLGQQQKMQEAQFAKFQQDQEAETALNDLYRGSVGATGQVDRNALLSGAASRGLGSRIPGLQEGFAKADKLAAETTKTGAETAGLQLKQHADALKLVGDTMAQLASNPNVTHDQVIQVLASLPPNLVPPDKTAMIVRQLPPNPQQLRQMLLMYGANADARLKALTPELQAINLGGTTQMVDRNAFTNPQAVGQSFTQTQTPESIASNQVAIRGQNLTEARGKESNVLKAQELAMGGKPPPGYRWAADGRLEAIPGGPGDKLPEKQQNQVIGAQNLSNAINEYRTQLKGFGKLDALSPDARAAMGTKYNNMMLQAKEAYNLGVLNGPDLEILTSVITDPRSMKGAITSNKALDAQASELDRIMQGISSVSANRRPQDAAKPLASPAAPKAGAIDGGYVFMGGDPADQKNWKKQ